MNTFAEDSKALAQALDEFQTAIGIINDMRHKMHISNLSKWGTSKPIPLGYGWTMHRCFLEGRKAILFSNPNRHLVAAIRQLVNGQGDTNDIIFAI